MGGTTGAGHTQVGVAESCYLSLQQQNPRVWALDMEVKSMLDFCIVKDAYKDA